MFNAKLKNQYEKFCRHLSGINQNSTTYKDIKFKYLDFSDIIKIDFDHFDKYIDKNPCIGFYISRFPQVKNNIIKISELYSKEEENKNNKNRGILNLYSEFKIPLALFEFRIFSGITCIEFQIPSEFPHDFVDEFKKNIAY